MSKIDHYYELINVILSQVKVNFMQISDGELVMMKQM